MANNETNGEMPNLGATGEFPKGKLGEWDEGELRIGVTHRDNNVEIHFGKEIAWLAMEPYEAKEFAMMIIHHAEMLEMEKKTKEREEKLKFGK